VTLVISDWNVTGGALGAFGRFDTIYFYHFEAKFSKSNDQKTL